MEVSFHWSLDVQVKRHVVVQFIRPVDIFFLGRSIGMVFDYPDLVSGRLPIQTLLTTAQAAYITEVCCNQIKCTTLGIGKRRITDPDKSEDV